MMELTAVQVILGIAAAVLTAYLFVRLRCKPPRLAASFWTGHGIEVGGLKSRVVREQASFRETRQGTTERVFYRKWMVAQAREAVRQLRFFAGKGKDGEGPS